MKECFNFDYRIRSYLLLDSENIKESFEISLEELKYHRHNTKINFYFENHLSSRCLKEKGDSDYCTL